MNERDTTDPYSQKPTADNGRNGASHQRLTDLERRANALEHNVQTLLTTTTEIKTRLETVATKDYVLYSVIIVTLISFLTIVAHVMLKSVSFGAPS